MIRELKNEDRKLILEYIRQEPEMNLFMLGDLENYGVCSENINFYAGECDDGSWDFLLLRFYEYYLIYSPDLDYDCDTAAEFLQARQPESISGKLELVQKLQPFFPQFSVQPTYMSRCNQVKSTYAAPEELSIRLLTEEDIPESVDLYLKIIEFAKTYEGRREKSIQTAKEVLRTGGKTIMGGYRNGVLTAIAETAAENSESAMITGVATDPHARGNGYASAVVSQLCRSCFSQGKDFLCLFYDNPAAGRIYKRIGFEEVGQYAMLR